MELSFEEAREKYKPERIKCLFLAEAPPKKDSKRFFYFENVPKGDTLYLTTMKALFANEFAHMQQNEATRKLRTAKSTYLKRFQQAGLYLEDASKVPMPHKPSAATKRQILSAELEGLQERMKPYIEKQTPVILISATVHDVCFAPLRNAGLNILNDKAIPFPIGFQPEYIAGIAECLRQVQ